LGSGLLGTVGCGSAGPSEPEIRFVVPDGHPEAATITVVGVPSHYLPSRSESSAADWPSILRVTVAQDGDSASGVADAGLPPVTGSYRVTGSEIVFTPMFGFDAGLRYRAVFDGSKLPATRDAWKPAPLVAIVGLPKRELSPTTVVDRIYPTSDIVPENQLRLYVHFSAPMGRKGGLDYMRLLDSEGHEVKGAFLPLEAEFWNGDRTRYTVFFDPGRVKRGILPNEQMGRPLLAGRQYSLAISREWRDAEGQPLKDDFRRTFRVGPADEQPLHTSEWRIREPAAGSLDPLIVVFPEPLDQGLLMRALGVETAAGRSVAGDVATGGRETQWAFTPRAPWAENDYRLVALTILEDLAGNRIGRAFEVDQFEQVDRQAEPERITLPFRVAKE